MQLIRSILFFVAFVGWTLFSGFLAPLTLPLTRTARAVSGMWARGAMWLLRVICGVKVRIEGREHMPKGSAFYVSKHQSTLDTLVLWVMLDGPVFILKRELFRIPIFGWFLWRTKPIAIDRKAGRRAVKQIEQQAIKLVKNGRNIVIFPEGTRRLVDAPPAYKWAGASALYQSLGLPLVPVALDTGRSWPKGAFVKQPATVTVRFLPPIAAGLSIEQMQQQVQTAIESACAQMV